MEEIIKIVMENQELTYEEAKALVDETTEEMHASPEDAEYILMDYLGLDPDYLIDLMRY